MGFWFPLPTLATEMHHGEILPFVWLLYHKWIFTCYLLVHRFSPINSDLTPESAGVSGRVGTVLKICASTHTEQQALKKQSKSEKALEVRYWSTFSIVSLLPRKPF